MEFCGGGTARRRKMLKVSRRAMRDASNPLALLHREFVAQFRLTKETFGELCREILIHEHDWNAQIIGCIDGTHITIIQPAVHEEAYFNQKEYHSHNVLVASFFL